MTINPEDLLNPDWWISQGITPIVINPADSESVETGIEKIEQEVKDAATEGTNANSDF